jgi:GT2 family glycosyltransferase
MAVVIVNWNRRADLLALLQSLDEAGYDGIDTIVVDNASTDDSVTTVRETYPRVRLIINPENLGGTGGFNTGLQQVLKGPYEYVWLLDNDALVKPGALEPMLEAMGSDERIALVGSKLLHPGDEGLINEAGALMSDLTASPRPQFANEIDGNLPQILDVDYVAVCSVLARLSHVRSVGLMDPSYFLMWDDMEWGVRFKHAGLRVVAATRSAVFHPGFTERKLTLAFIYYANRNHLYFVAKNYPGLHRWYLLALLSGAIEYRRARERFSRRRLHHAETLNLAVRDFWRSRMGRHHYSFASLVEPTGAGNLYEAVRDCKRVAVSANADSENVSRILSLLTNEDPSIGVVLFGQYRRKNLFRRMGRGIWTRKGIWGYLNLAVRMASGRFDAVILNPRDPTQWVHHLGRKLIRVDAEGRVISSEAPTPWRMFVRDLFIPVVCLFYFSVGACRGLWRSLTWNTVAKIRGQLAQLHRQGI